MKIGIYPGAFDPINNSHLAFARAAQAAFDLDKVFFLPEPTPTHKQGVKALQHRSNMVHLAAANIATFGVMIADTPTFDIRHIWPRVMSRFSGSELFMLIGNNPVRRLGDWPMASELGKQTPTFIIASRESSRHDVTDQINTLLETKHIDMRFHVLPGTYPVADAVEIRRDLRKSGASSHVPQAVLEYIAHNKLYMSGAS